ncbi:MAG: PAS domain S-box protein [Chitinophagaceae bacterium]|nr:PAS domain S-box protein [Chitinophagaceae bacterium]
MNDSILPLPTEDILALFQSTPDLVCIADKEGYFRNFNPAVPATLGYSTEELLSRPIIDFMHPDDRERTSARRARLLKGETMLNFRNRYISGKGEVIWLEWTSIFLKERKLVLAIAKNITAHKQIEQQVEEEFLKLKHQAVHLKSNLEKERRHVAVELHEDLAQLASAIRVDIDWLSSNIQQGDKNVATRVEHARVTADLLVNTLRRLSFSISPAMLDDLGLDATLQWFCREFSTTTGIDCMYENAVSESLLTKEISLDFFRITQDVLNSISQHSQATCVQVSIKKTGKTTALSITNDDKSYRLDEVQQSGIISIEERVASLGGTCVIDANNIIVEVQLSN